jgi:hypothetical protein
VDVYPLRPYLRDSFESKVEMELSGIGGGIGSHGLWTLGHSETAVKRLL